jgi:NAD(P)-dependent dehydrogenase (short-subunit alcohol dehydrogenase family)
MPVAIITGGSKGFGRALATDLARDGWGLVIDGRTPGPLAEAARELEGLGVPVRALAGDIVDPGHRSDLLRAAEELGSLDLLVNNASTLGVSPLPRLEGYPLAELRRVYEVNTVAPLALVQSALPRLRQRAGTLVSVSSDAAVEAYPGWGGYGSSKAALDHLHRVLAVEEPGLRIYQFDPGDMRTEMHQAAFPGEDIADRPEPATVVPSLRRLLDSGLPSGRYRAEGTFRPPWPRRSRARPGASPAMRCACWAPTGTAGRSSRARSSSSRPSSSRATSWSSTRRGPSRRPSTPPPTMAAPWSCTCRPGSTGRGGSSSCAGSTVGPPAGGPDRPRTPDWRWPPGRH